MPKLSIDIEINFEADNDLAAGDTEIKKSLVFTYEDDSVSVDDFKRAVIAMHMALESIEGGVITAEKDAET